MRQSILLFTILFSGFCFSQNTGSIMGIVLDEEFNNNPLIHANVSIKGTTQESSSDTNGIFYFNNLEEGNYTLVFSFTGYETKEYTVQIVSDKQIDVSASLIASTISFDDLALLSATAKQDGKSSIVLNN
jgi:hypothetical protein